MLGAARDLPRSCGSEFYFQSIALLARNI